jgi:hypothetical protein
MATSFTGFRLTQDPSFPAMSWYSGRSCEPSAFDNFDHTQQAYCRIEGVFTVFARSKTVRKSIVHRGSGVNDPPLLFGVPLGRWPR